MESKSISENGYWTAIDLLAYRSDDEIRLRIYADAVCSAEIDLWLDFPCNRAYFQDITGLVIYNVLVYFYLPCITAALAECFNKPSFKLTVEQCINGNITQLRYFFTLFLPDSMLLSIDIAVFLEIEPIWLLCLYANKQ